MYPDTHTHTHTHRERERERKKKKKKEALNKVLFDSHVTCKPINRVLVNFKPPPEDLIYNAVKVTFCPRITFSFLFTSAP